MKWIDVAMNEIGQLEGTGTQDNQRILEYFKAVVAIPMPHDEIPWCAVFVGWVLRQCGISPTCSAYARSYLKWGETLPEFRPGCIVVLKRGSKPYQGPVGFALKKSIGFIDILGGNQANEVKISRFWFPKVLGFRWHPEFSNLM